MAKNDLAKLEELQITLNEMSERYEKNQPAIKELTDAFGVAMFDALKSSKCLHENCVSPFGIIVAVMCATHSLVAISDESITINDTFAAFNSFSDELLRVKKMGEYAKEALQRLEEK